MKKLSLVSLGIMSFSTIVLGASPVFASPEQPEAKTEATVEFEVDDETVPPVVPPTTEEGGEDGGGTVDPNKPGTDGENGDGNPSFNITHVSNFRFNEKERDTDGTAILENGAFKWKPIKLNNNLMTLYAYGTDLALFRQNKEGNWINSAGEAVENEADAQKLAYTDIPNFVQVTDNRGNKKAGWRLEVSRTQFTDGTDELTGAELSLNDAFIKGPSGVTAPVFTKNDVVIPTTGSTVVMDAATGAGTGSWSLSFGELGEDLATVVGTENEETPVTYGQLALVDGKPKSGVKLVVPAEAQAQAGAVYTADLTWTLSSVPAE